MVTVQKMPLIMADTSSPFCLFIKVENKTRGESFTVLRSLAGPGPGKQTGWSAPAGKLRAGPDQVPRRPSSRSSPSACGGLDGRLCGETEHV